MCARVIPAAFRGRVFGPCTGTTPDGGGDRTSKKFPLKVKTAPQWKTWTQFLVFQLNYIVNLTTNMIAFSTSFFQVHITKMADNEQPKGKVTPKQESPVKDAVRSLEAQLASETSSVPPQEVASSPSDTTTLQTASSVEPMETVTMSQTSSEDHTTSEEQQHQVVVHIHEEEPMEHQEVVMNQEQPVVTNMEQQQLVINQEQSMVQSNMEQQEVVVNMEQPQQVQQVVIHQEQPMAIGEQMLQVIADGGEPQQQDSSRHQKLHVNAQPDVMHQQQHQVLPQTGALHVTQSREATQVQQEAPSAENSSQVEAAGSGKDKTTFKCVAVSADGNPDWSKVMSLDRDILKEVFEKHGISMDTSDWPTQKNEDAEARKKRKLAKKAKKKKKKEKNKKSKGSTYIYLYLQI